MSARLLIGAVLLAVAGAGVAGASISSCIDTSGDELFACPSQPVFTGIEDDGGVLPGAAVSEYMDRRCGTLDCHGSDARPMRLYGHFGLREPAESNVSGGKATTLAELKANYGAVCSIEPEKTAADVENQGVSADQLLVVLKARGQEAHKGGTIFKIGDPGDDCITGWLRGDPAAMVGERCQTAIDGL